MLNKNYFFPIKLRRGEVIFRDGYRTKKSPVGKVMSLTTGWRRCWRHDNARMRWRLVKSKRHGHASDKFTASAHLATYRNVFLATKNHQFQYGRCTISTTFLFLLIVQ